MKQRISVRAIIKRDNKVLLVRRKTGTPTLKGLYELPGGKLEFGEHPLDALHREINEELGVHAETMQLHSIVSHFDVDNRDTQFLTVVYVVALASGDGKITLSPSHDKYVWQIPETVQINEVTQTTSLSLELVQPERGEVEVSNIELEKNADKNATYKHVIVYSDGGSRGNPGPSATGFVVMDSHENVLYEGGKYIGITTNNQAEYQAVLQGLEKAAELGATVVEFRLDSLLVVNQLNGIYQIKNKELWPVYYQIKQLSETFEKASFTHVRREFNKLADGMVNKVLDEQAQ